MKGLDALKGIAGAWYIAVAAFVLICGCAWVYIDMQPARYQASATLTSNNAQIVFSVAQEEILKDPNSDSKFYMGVNTKNGTVTIRAIGADGQSCIDSVNELIGYVAERLGAEQPEVTVDIKHPKKARDISIVKSFDKIMPIVVVAALVIGLCLALLVGAMRARRRKLNDGIQSKAPRAEEGALSPNDYAAKTRLLLYCVISFGMVLTAQSLYGRLESWQVPINAVLLIACIALVVVTWRVIIVNSCFVMLWAVWVMVLVLGYTSVVLVNGYLGNVRLQFMVAYCAISPLVIYVVRGNDELPLFLGSFTTIVTILAGCSLLLWLLGPIAGAIQPNMTIESNWSGTGTVRQLDGYCCLLFQVQTYSSDIYTGWRNTGIFVEAPMYAFALCVALCFEVFFQRRPNKAVCAILAVTAITTISTTALILLVGITVICVFNWALKKEGTSKHIAIAVLVIVVVAGAIVAVLLLSKKLSTGSGITRLDDYFAGFAAWQRSPIFGEGFGMHSAANLFKNPVRAYDIGFSNTVFWELYQGGLVFFLPHLCAFAGYFAKKPELKFAEAGLCLMVLWVTTIVAISPITSVILGIGAERLFRILGSSESDEGLCLASDDLPQSDTVRL